MIYGNICGGAFINLVSRVKRMKAEALLVFRALKKK